MNRNDTTLDLMVSIENATKGAGPSILSSFAVTAIDRTGNESDFVVYPIN